jgi:endonuclease III
VYNAANERSSVAYLMDTSGRIIAMNEDCQSMRANAIRSQQASSVVELLALEYGEPRWRPTGKPVDELVQTILSQNTSDINTNRAFASLTSSFPRWQDARDAAPNEIAAAIHSAGLSNRKAPRILDALHDVVAGEDVDPNRSLLRELERLGLDRAKQRLTRLPGVGPKTAACVLLFAAGMPALPVDTHVYRVSRRIGLLREGVSPDRAHDELEAIVEPDQVYQFHVLLIRHGREICRARRPQCERCPLTSQCAYARERGLYASGRVGEDVATESEGAG